MSTPNAAAEPAAPVRLGLTGLGGYAHSICRLLMAQRLAEAPAVRLVAVCEPNLAAHSALVDELRGQGVHVGTSWDALLALPLEGVWLPLPIPLHRPYTEQALAAGKAVLCEKPAAATVQDLDAMRRARDRAGLPVALGFQDVYDPLIRTLKSALRAGEIGQVRSATLTACWPRDSHYFGRSAWAGRQKQGGAWVMDSPASNALAHFIHLALFLMGEGENQSAVPQSVEAELYRANPIENYDTCGLRVVTDSGASLLALLTHACREEHHPRIVVHGEQGTLTYVMDQYARLQTPQGERTLPLAGRDAARTDMVERFAHLVRGTADSRVVATLEMARAHLVAVNGASEASPVRDVPDSFVELLPRTDGSVLRCIPGIEALFQRCVQEQRLPHELGTDGWTAPAGRLDLRGYHHFSGPAGEKG